MKVKLIATGEILEVNASFGSRLCEQGKAVAAAEAPKPKKSRKAVKADGAEG